MRPGRTWRGALTNTEVVVEPIDLARNKLAGEESAIREDLSDFFLLSGLGRER